MTLFKKALACTAIGLMLGSGAAAEELSPPPLFSNNSQFIEIRPVSTAPETAVRTLTGKHVRLSQFRGRVIILNFWATWCAPCVYEMPSLDRLAANANEHDLTVLAVSIDRSSPLAVGSWLASHHLTHLQVAVDPDQRLGTMDLKGIGDGRLPIWSLPVSYIIDRQGRVLGYIGGSAKWDSPEARSFVRYFEDRAR